MEVEKSFKETSRFVRLIKHQNIRLSFSLRLLLHLSGTADLFLHYLQEEFLTKTIAIRKTMSVQFTTLFRLWS